MRHEAPSTPRKVVLRRDVGSRGGRKENKQKKSKESHKREETTGLFTKRPPPHKEGVCRRRVTGPRRSGTLAVDDGAYYSRCPLRSRRITSQEILGCTARPRLVLQGAQRWPVLRRFNPVSDGLWPRQVRHIQCLGMCKGIGDPPAADPAAQEGAAPQFGLLEGRHFRAWSRPLKQSAYDYTCGLCRVWLCHLGGCICKRSVWLLLCVRVFAA